jgi:hypothetical protein
MTSTQSDQNLLKTDTRGRVRTPRAQRDTILAEFAASGLSAARFAQLAGIKYSTLYGWLHRQRKANPVGERGRAAIAAPARPTVALFETVVESTAVRAAAGGLALELPGGGRTRVESPLQLRLAAELLRLLEQTEHRPC